MEDNDKADQNAANSNKSEAKDAVGSENLQELIKNITLTALSQQQLDKENIKQVVSSVLEGVTEGVGDSAERMKPQFNEALAGIDAALSKSAIAAKLATEEAAGKVEQFAKQDVKKAIDELSSLEDLFIDTVNTVASQSGQLSSSALKEVAEHFKNSGTASGKEALEAVNSLKNALLNMSKGSIDEIASATQTAGNQFGQIASGILAGMAEAVKPKK